MFFITYYHKIIFLEESQNIHEEAQQKEVSSLEAQPTIASVISNTTVVALTDVKEEKSNSPQPLTTEHSYQNEPQTQTMEVHKHPHHVMHSKKWHEYLLEFLMIFLAVTLGFFAENIRETYSEKKNAKEYAQLLVSDLASDTTEFNKTIRVISRIINSGDSLSTLITSNMSAKNSGGKLYYYEYWSGWRWRVTSYDATLKQLESSGSLRYLGNKALIKKILDYEESLKVIALIENNLEDEKNENWKLVQKIFYQKYFDSLDNIKAAARDSSSQTSEADAYRLNTFLNNNYPLITYDSNMIIQLSNWAFNSSRSYRVQLKNVVFTKEKAKDAIAALKEEYDFE